MFVDELGNERLPRSSLNSSNLKPQRKMKKNFTLQVLTVCLCLISLSPAQAQLSSIFNFASSPEIVSGTNKAINSAYRFINVAPGIDAIVTIVSSTGGATVQDLDDVNFADPMAFSPIVRVSSNSTGSVQFKIDFVIIGTNIPKAIDSITVINNHIDGSDDLKEFGSLNINGGAGSLMSTTPEIQIANSGNTFTGTNTAGMAHSLPDNNFAPVMFQVKNKNVTSVVYVIGAVNNSHEDHRVQSLTFKGSSVVAAVLPVKYLSFDGNMDDKSIELNWTITEAINHNYFEVERSFDKTDFQTIGVVLDGFEIGGGKKSYQYKDAGEVFKGQSIVYYRLKQFDIDGKFSFSKIVMMRLQASNAVVMQVLPNPFVESLSIRYTAATNNSATVQLLSATGLQVIAKNTTVTEGNNSIQLDGLTNLAKGMYIARLVIDGKVIASEKIIKN